MSIIWGWLLSNTQKILYDASPFISTFPMSFSFNFLLPANDQESDAIPQSSKAVTSQLLSPLGTKISETKELSSRSFQWLPTDDVKRIIESAFQNNSILDDKTVVKVNTIHLSKPTISDTTNIPVSSLSFIRQIVLSNSEWNDSITTNTKNYSSKTDLVPGVYEGGLKVWECSTDLCQYLYEKYRDDIATIVNGHVLELGCGHGLPSCWILKQAMIKHHDHNCYVVCSDYNDFVLQDVTIPNLVLNVSDAARSITTNSNATDQQNILSEWLLNHVALGAGDWNDMSSILLKQQQEQQHEGDFSTAAVVAHPAIPCDGLFDVILAAETTYSQTAAVETAAFIVRHLRPKTGMAYVATKRYYFGVGGGTNCLVNAINNRPSGPRFLHCEILQVYDNGGGNIRELLLIKDA
jgi:hypothetical protein